MFPSAIRQLTAHHVVFLLIRVSYIPNLNLLTMARNSMLVLETNHG